MGVINQNAINVGMLADRLVQGYYAHRAALLIAADPRAKALAPDVLSNRHVSVEFVPCKDGTKHEYAFTHYLNLIKTDLFINDELTKVWLAGSLLTLGDNLAKHKYFDNAPILELVFHLRNGIAHGNRFRIDNPSKLSKNPAHNRYANVRSNSGTVFEITPAVEARTVLFDFMGAGDVLNVLTSVSCYLHEIGNQRRFDPVEHWLHQIEGCQIEY